MSRRGTLTSMIEWRPEASQRGIWCAQSRFLISLCLSWPVWNTHLEILFQEQLLEMWVRMEFSTWSIPPSYPDCRSIIVDRYDIIADHHGIISNRAVTNAAIVDHRVIPKTLWIQNSYSHIADHGSLNSYFYSQKRINTTRCHLYMTPWQSADAHSLFSTSWNILLVYWINRRGPNTLPCGTPEIIGIHSPAAPSTTTLCLRSERNSVQMYSLLPPTPIDFN